MVDSHRQLGTHLDRHASSEVAMADDAAPALPASLQTDTEAAGDRISPASDPPESTVTKAKNRSSSSSQGPQSFNIIGRKGIHIKGFSLHPKSRQAPDVGNLPQSTDGPTVTRVPSIAVTAPVVEPNDLPMGPATEVAKGAAIAPVTDIAFDATGTEQAGSPNFAVSAPARKQNGNNTLESPRVAIAPQGEYDRPDASQASPTSVSSVRKSSEAAQEREAVMAKLKASISKLEAERDKAVADAIRSKTALRSLVEKLGPVMDACVEADTALRNL